LELITGRSKVQILPPQSSTLLITGESGTGKELVARAMTDLNSLIMFAKVVEANSFSGAARLLNVPISTVSRRIAELGGQLGVQWLERSTGSLRLTDIGSELLENAQCRAELDEAVGDSRASPIHYWYP
jgi:Bacterial regulatory helix-turn-helix protein, lysR family/Sigma-54 interaction domain